MCPVCVLDEEAGAVSIYGQLLKTLNKLQILQCVSFESVFSGSLKVFFFGVLYRNKPGLALTRLT
jgi:hypothetical protein